MLQRHFQLLVLTVLVFSASIQNVLAMEGRWLLGLQPSVTIEPFYEKDEMDVNVLPIVLGVGLSKNSDFRTTVVVNYHLSQSMAGVEQLGLQWVVPYRFAQVSSQRYFYAGPCAGYARWLLSKLDTVTVCAETGIQFIDSSRLDLMFGLQFGATHFSKHPQVHTSAWDSHFGMKFTLAYWL